MRQTVEFPIAYRRTRAWLSRFVVLAICMFALSGCFLQSIVGFVGDDGSASLSGNLEIGFCNSETSIPEFRGCTYTIKDGDGFLIEITSTFQLVSEFGFFGVLIDPLVLQVPDDVTAVVATYNNAGSDDPLVVTETISFLVTPTTTVTAETGTKFLILELPDAVAAALPPGASDFNFSLDFDTDDPLNLFVKSMLTASYDEGGQRYYLPMFPCVTDFSAIPATQIPVDASFQFLNPTFAPLYNNAALACDQVVYDFANVSPVLCGGLAVTIDMNTNGGVGTGTAGADVILGTALADVIDGGDGDDTICADRGDDTVYGGPGDDRIFGGQGADTIRGADGNDTIHGNRGDDVLFGGAGNDRIFGYAHNDTIAGGPGDDRLHGNFGDDIITGDGGNDRIFGYGDSDDLDGGAGDDLISGNFGDDVLNGGDGNDELFGADGDDEVNGGEGNDLVNGNSLNDVLQGGGGDDVLDGGIDTDSCDGGPGVDTATRCETVTGVP